MVRFFLAALDQRAHMVRPQHQRSADLALIGTAVVDTGDAGLVPRDVVEHRLDDVRLNAEVGHPRRNGPAQIMQSPVSHLAGGPECPFGLSCPSS